MSRSKRSKGNLQASWRKCRDCDRLCGIGGPAGGDVVDLQPPPVGTCLPNQNGCRFRGQFIDAWWPKSGSRSYNKLWSLLNMCYLIVSSYQLKTIKWRKLSKQCQMIPRAYIPRNTKPAWKRGIFTNVPALTSRKCEIYTHIPEFCIRQSILKRHSLWITL